VLEIGRTGIVDLLGILQRGLDPVGRRREGAVVLHGVPPERQGEHVGLVVDAPLRLANDGCDAYVAANIFRHRSNANEVMRFGLLFGLENLLRLLEVKTARDRVRGPGRSVERVVPVLAWTFALLGARRTNERLLGLVLVVGIRHESPPSF